MLIEQALRDEGASYHCMLSSEYAHLADRLQQLLEDAFTGLIVPVQRNDLRNGPPLVIPGGVGIEMVFTHIPSNSWLVASRQ